MPRGPGTYGSKRGRPAKKTMMMKKSQKKKKTMGRDARSSDRRGTK
jgi:hypothetical protein